MSEIDWLDFSSVYQYLRKKYRFASNKQIERWTKERIEKAKEKMKL